MVSHEGRLEFFSGVKAMLPILLGVIPFGVTYGVLALAAGLDARAALGMSSIVYAGSAQIVALQLFSMSASAVVMIITILMVNIRHVLYSASVAPRLKTLSFLWKCLLSYLLTDESYAVTIIHYQETLSSNKHWFFLGAGLTMWSAWQISTGAGLVLGAVIPRNWPLDFAITLTFIALLVPTLKDRPSIVVSITAGIVALSTIDLSFRLNLVLAVLVAVTVGLLVEYFEQVRG
jgi:4-azaleucine resistance transporter AzlC